MHSHAGVQKSISNGGARCSARHVRLSEKNTFGAGRAIERIERRIMRKCEKCFAKSFGSRRDVRDPIDDERLAAKKRVPSCCGAVYKCRFFPET